MPKCIICGKDVWIFRANLFGKNVCPACISIEGRSSVEGQKSEAQQTIEHSNPVAFALAIIAVIELIASPIAGIAVFYSVNTLVGCLVFVSGVYSALILLGFATVIEYSFQSAQRVCRIEALVKRVSGDINTHKDAPVPATHAQPISPSQEAPDLPPISRPYFFSVDGRDSGPHSLDEMRRFRKSGKLTDETLVIRKGDSEWQRANMFTEICF